MELRLETHWLVRLSSNSVVTIDKVAEAGVESETVLDLQEGEVLLLSRFSGGKLTVKRH